MAGEVRDVADRPETADRQDRLDSWKEIAAYLKRDVTTVRRWEKREGLPVQRHLHDRRDSVYAYSSELDRWWQNRPGGLADNGTQPRARTRREPLPWVLSAVSLAAAVASIGTLALVYPRSIPAHVDQLRFVIDPPPRTTFGSSSLSPDGRHLAFTASTTDGKRLLWVRPLSSETAAPLPGTDDATFPFWSPDSRSIGFFAMGKLRTIALSGETPHIVCDAPSGRGGTWNGEGTILFAPGGNTGLFRVPASGGKAIPVTVVDRPRERGHMWPEFLPDGRHFLYLADSHQPERHGVYVAALDAPAPRPLLSDATNVAYAHEGYLLFARERRLVAQAFDVARFSMTGDPIVVGASVREHFDVEHLFDFSISGNGLLAYRGMPKLETRLVWRDRAGAAAPFADTQALYADPTLSPDGRRMAVDIFDPLPSPRFGFGLGNWTSDIWLFDVASGAGSRFTLDHAADFDPVWSPDGERIVFSSNRAGSLDLYAKDIAGGAEELLLRSGTAKHAQSWSPDGRFIVYATLEQKTRWDLWMLPTFGDRQPKPLLQTEFNENQATVSPDGGWIAYTSNESGRNEVYMQRFPSLEGKRQISSGGGGDARWRADGLELSYIAEDRMLMAVTLGNGERFQPRAARPLFDTGHQPGWAVARNHYDLSRDGNRVLIMDPVDDGRSSTLTVILNWAATVRK